MQIFMIFLGGGLGSILRYLTQTFFNKNFAYAYPWGTFCVNVLGCLFLGFLFGVTMSKVHWFEDSTKLFFTVGLMGGFTTFSTFGLESVNMFEKGQMESGFIYIASSIVLGIAAVYAGMQLAKYV